MQGKHLYEYAVIRVVPKVEREEFLNVGIILFSKRGKYIRMLYTLDKERLRLFAGEPDIDLIEKTLDSFEKIASGQKEGGIIAGFDISERFRWITAERSSCIQTSRPHAGFSGNLEETANKLFRELVL